ncbi:hypothetical protein [Streptomyces antibioticus]|uniref:hypothetical protein n=1 Tax=Streptomyces antibioticus TaxID=1890 RepID=UPI003D72A455
MVLAQVVAATAGGALIAIAGMLAYRLYVVQRRTDEQRRIDSAISAVLEGVEAARRQSQAQTGAAAGSSTAAVDAVEKGHLRLVTGRASRGAGRATPRARAARSGPARAR